MSGAQSITVIVDGTTHVVHPTAGDLVRLEREFQIVASSMTEENTSVGQIMFLAWAACRRTGVIARELTFDEFLDLADNGPPADPSLPPPPA